MFDLVVLKNKILKLLSFIILTVVAVFIAFNKGKKTGRQEIKEETNEKILNQTEQVQQIIHDVGNLSATERDRLRREYTRD